MIGYSVRRGEGFTLIEVMMAFAILVCVVVGLGQAILISARTTRIIRDDAEILRGCQEMMDSFTITSLSLGEVGFSVGSDSESHTFSVVPPDQISMDVGDDSGNVIDTVNIGITQPFSPSGSDIVKVNFESENRSTPILVHYFANPSPVSPLAIRTISLCGPGEVGVEYRQTVCISGGVPGYEFTLSSGLLPSGLNIDSITGEISGVPTTVDTYYFTVQVTDGSSSQQLDAQAFSIVIRPPVDITTMSLPDGVFGLSYSQNLAVADGVSPYTWGLAGVLPPGLNLDSNTGVISGTPTTTGTYSFVVSVTDSCTCNYAGAASENLSIIVTDDVLAVATESLPNGTKDIDYSQTLAAVNGITPYTWTVISGSLPDGLTLDSAAIAGVPTAEGIYDFTVQVTDSSSPTQIANKALSIEITPPLVVTTTSPLPDGAIDIAYSQTLEATGGTPGYIWSITGGSLPSGLSLNTATGEISGIPVEATSDPAPIFDVRVEDVNGVSATKTFSIKVVPTCIVNTATIPSGPVSVLEDVGYEYSTGGSTCWNGHDVQYRFDWGDGTFSDWLPVGTTSATKIWTVPGTYDVKAQARCATTNAESAWSDALPVVIVPNCTVSTPTTPSGDTSGNTGTSYTYSTGGSICSNGHDVQYRFDWGDGTFSDGLPVGTTSAEKTWTAAGTYLVRAQARCPVTLSESAWSDALTVEILPLCSVAAPTTPSGDTTGMTGTSYTYLTEGSSCSNGHDMQYQFDWGDGTFSDWLPVGTTSATKTWTVPGTYDVKAQARCAATLTESTWSDALTVTIIPDCTVGTPTIPSGNASGNTGISYTYSTGGSSCSGGHDVQYRFDWGDGTFSDGLPVGTTSAEKTWTAAGTYLVRAQARCAVTLVESAWSEALTVEIFPPCSVAAPTMPSGNTPGTTGTSYAYSTGGSNCSNGHDVQYQFDWGDGTFSDWLPVGTTSATKTWTVPGTYDVKAQARCAATLTESAWSDAITVTIVDPLQVTTASLPDGQASVAYSQTLTASGGATPYTWAITSGSLPAGLSLSSSGVISGTPTTANTYDFTVQVTDAYSNTAAKALSITIASAETVVTIGTGTSTSECPFDGWNAYSRGQMIYLQSEVAHAGNITKIRLHNAVTDKAFTFTTVTIHMRSDATVPNVNGEDVWLAEGTLVLNNGSLSVMPGSNQWYEFVLDTPFNYTNTHNLLVSIRHQTGDNIVFNDVTWYATDQGFFSTDHKYAKGTSDTVNPPPVYNNRYRPNIQLVIEP